MNLQWDLPSLILLMTMGAFLVLFWPWRRETRFDVRRTIAAPREALWDAYMVDLTDPQNAAFHDRIDSHEILSQDPEIHEDQIDISGGRRQRFMTARTLVLEKDFPARYASRVEALDDKDFPFGESNAEILELNEVSDGTEAILAFQGEVGSVFQKLHLKWILFQYLKKLQRFCEDGVVPAGPASSARSLWISIFLSVLAVASFTYWFGWLLGLLVSALLVLHEFGHWLAMRLTGQPSSRFMLIPFFGGIAVAEQPHKSLFDDAFCSLMGPGFSALICLPLMLLAYLLGTPENITVFVSEEYISMEPAQLFREALSALAILLALCIGGLNLLQMVPVLPLDGGQILRAVMQSFSASKAMMVLLAIAGLGIGIAISKDLYVVAMVLAVGGLQAWHVGGEDSTARPMRAASMVTIVAGYFLVLAIHGSAIYLGLDLLDGF